MNDPWFAEGLSFGCRRCGSCCTGEPGYVFLKKGEARAIAGRLGLEIKEFRALYTHRAGGRTSLIEEEDGRCVFFSDEGCRIYPVRPLQCRTFPFWLWNVAKRENWEATASGCPGMNRGRCYTLKEIEDLLARRIG